MEPYNQGTYVSGEYVVEIFNWDWRLTANVILNGEVVESMAFYDDHPVCKRCDFSNPEAMQRTAALIVGRYEAVHNPENSPVCPA